MTVTIYQSTDSSAPVLKGQFGSLTTLLDACLVNGYGSKAAAGWTIAYTATNNRAYRMSTSSSTGYFLNVQDMTPGGTYGAQDALFTGFKSMSAINTGTGQFPTYAQSGFWPGGLGGMPIRKSNTEDATARPWTLVANATCFYLFVDSGDATGESRTCGFGDIFAYGATDTNYCLNMGRIGAGGNSANDTLPILDTVTTCIPSVTGGWLADSWTGSAGSTLAGKISDKTKGGQNIVCGGASSITYPNGPDAALLIAPIYVMHNGSVRGYLKGLWNPLTSRPIAHNDTFSGTGNMTGKTFLAKYCSSQGYPGELIVETSDTWG